MNEYASKTPHFVIEKRDLGEMQRKYDDMPQKDREIWVFFNSAMKNYTTIYEDSISRLIDRVKNFEAEIINFLKDLEKRMKKLETKIK